MGTKYFDSRQAAEYLGLSVGTLENYRTKGIGPAYVQRVKRGKVFYDPATLDAWRAGQVRTSTSEIRP